ncbi:MAG: hypothetical protein ACOC9Y_08695 [Chloroflexota bacterium]
MNLFVIADRFGVAAESYDHLSVDLDALHYVNADEPVEIELRFQNDSPSTIQVRAIEFTMTANGVRVGGDDSRLDVEIDPESHQTLNLEGRITDRNVMERAEEPDGNSWLILGRMLIQVDGDLEPTWISIGFRTES